MSGIDVHLIGIIVCLVCVFYTVLVSLRSKIPLLDVINQWVADKREPFLTSEPAINVLTAAGWSKFWYCKCRFCKHRVPLKMMVPLKKTEKYEMPFFCDLLYNVCIKIPCMYTTDLDRTSCPKERGNQSVKLVSLWTSLAFSDRSWRGGFIVSVEGVNKMYQRWDIWKGAGGGER